MFSSSSNDKSCRLGEINGDYALNSCSLENYLEIDVLSKGGIPGVIKEHGRVDSSSIIVDRDPMQEPFFFQADTISSFPNHMETHEKAAICFYDHHVELENVVEEVIVTINCEEEFSNVNEVL